PISTGEIGLKISSPISPVLFRFGPISPPIVGEPGHKPEATKSAFVTVLISLQTEHLNSAQFKSKRPVSKES
ncbi:Uncharacterized protein APZ42_002502, partial [Daphnia magna]